MVTPHADAGPRRRPESRRVRVRMYRQGLGDCFLLSFLGWPEPRHVLVDCGVIVGTPDGTERMRRVATDIKKASDGRLDLVVITHEHWDHVSGFQQARDIFDEIGIGEVWAAWTENPADVEAAELDRARARALDALEAYMDRVGAAAPDALRPLVEMLGFAGIELGADGRTPKRTGRTRDARDYVLERGRRAGSALHYLEPGDGPLDVAGVEGVRAYALGPPRGAMLRKTGGSVQRGEVYGLLGGAGGSFVAFALGLAEDRTPFDSDDGAAPLRLFDDSTGIDLAGVDREDWPTLRAFAAYFGSVSDDPRWLPEPVGWRQIEDVGLGAAEALALQLDNATNNTSLVLAFELPDGRVLLFPGDAQIGSWLSWAELRWPRDAPVGAPGTVGVADLLARTVLYKVGHHGSHNATLRKGGLEAMRSPELVAMLPVDERFAHESKGWTRMPLPALIDELRARTRGRLIRSDQLLHAAPELPGGRVLPPLLADGMVPAEFAARLQSEDDELYVDYVLPLPAD